MKHLASLLAAPALFGAFVVAFGGTGCGARTELVLPDARDADAETETEPPKECLETKDCPGFDDKCAPVSCLANKCVAGAKVVCDDKDPCTDDTCEPATGKCKFEPSTLDLDGDGHRAPLAGKKPGEPGSCGDDCDDKSAAAFPGNKEICDGVDNDCDGIVDNDARYVPPATGPDAIRVSGDVQEASPAGLAFANEQYLAMYNGRLSGKLRVYGAALDPLGNKLSESLLNKSTVDSVEGRVAWNGAQFGVVWSDRRDASWELYFSRLDKTGAKLDPDLRISEGDGSWSIGASLVWTGKEFVVAFQDQRDLDPQFNVWGQRISVDGKLVGGNVKLVDDVSSGPDLAVGLGTLGIVWTQQISATQYDSYLRILSRELAPVSEPIKISSGKSGESPTIVWNGDRYVVAFFDKVGAPKTIYGAAYDEKGGVVVPLTQLTESPKFSRYPTMLPLGDRLLLVWSDTKDGASGYELYSKMLDKKLVAIGGESRITSAPGESVGAGMAFGPKGDVGVLFRDDRLGTVQTYFTRLVCTAGK
ncbi:MAG: putative metal-binding motif-containing protein [Myxococcales bacterium]|nr:putative metal-binding motif-containing protein [Myxococcales bacterium]